MTQEELREYYRQYQRKRHADLRSRGLCVDCGADPAEPNRIKCKRCAAVQVAKQLAKRNALKASGMCTVCGKNPSRENRTLCADCAKRHAQYMKTYNRKKRGEIE